MVENNKDDNRINKKAEPLTLGFMQVGLDIVTSANCKSQLQFQLDE